MREIKFRAWDKTRKQIFKVTNIDLLRERVEIWVSLIATVLRFSEIELMQYTGLKDKNSVEIYEGDILKNEKGYIGYVAFLKQESGYVVVLKNSDYRLGHRNTGEHYKVAQGHEVIGNKFDNPELLD